MDSNEINKIAGAVIGSVLVFLLLGFFSEKVFGTRPTAHAEHEVLAFALDTGEEEADASGEPEEEPALDLVQLASAADPAAGEKVFNKCKACHKVEDGANGVGPHLYNVMGREIASVSDYTYSSALGSKEGPWGVENMMAWLGAPGEFAPGNKMGYALPDPEERMHVIAYLNEAGSAPIDLTAGLGGGEEEAAAEGETEMAEAEAPAEEPAAAEDAAAEDAATKDAPVEEAAAEDPAPAEDAATEEAAVEEAAAEEPAPAEEAAAEEAPVEEAAAEEPAPAEAEAEAPAAEETEVAMAPEAEAEPAAEASGGAIPAAYADVFANASVEAGERVYRRCQACHKVQEGVNGVGPHLYGVIGRPVASVEGFRYSDALQAKSDQSWTVENMMAWLEAPREWAPGNKMAFALRGEEDRANVILYLNSQSDAPLDLK